MAKTSSMQKNARRQKMAGQYANRRKALKEIVMNRELSFEERFQATIKLSEMPRNSAQIRYRNRCQLTGRSRGNYAKFGLSRITFRDMSSEALIPGVTKSSW